jgi:uncharacterized protein YggE
MFAVTQRDPAAVDALISNVLATGVNHLLNVDFRTSDLKLHREQARELAVKAAHEKAQKMASAAGASVGAAMQINEDQRYTYASYNSSWTGANWGGARDMGGPSQVSAQVSSGEASEVVALGRVAVRASVNVSFELKR